MTLGVPIVVRNLTFNASAYTLTGSTLTLGGIAPTIDLTPATTTTIASAIAGTAGLTTIGAGTLTLKCQQFSDGLTLNGSGATI